MAGLFTLRVFAKNRRRNIFFVKPGFVSRANKPGLVSCLVLGKFDIR